MENKKNSNTLQMNYTFTSDFSNLSAKEKKNPAVALNVEGILEIKINGDLYFEEDIALLELFLYIDRWLKKVEKKGKFEFHYYTLEIDEDSPIISLLPFNNNVRLNVLWPVENLYNVFDWDYILKEFNIFHKKLSKDIEEHYAIDLRNFIGNVPLRKLQ